MVSAVWLLTRILRTHLSIALRPGGGFPDPPSWRAALASPPPRAECEGSVPASARVVYQRNRSGPWLAPPLPAARESPAGSR